MARILLAYGTTEGHTAKIAQRMAEAMGEGGYDVEVVDAKELPVRTLEDGYDGILVGGSARKDVRATIDKFLAETGWKPERVEPIAGALVYTQYNVFIRHLMKLIAKRHGQPTDTSHDHDYTDWQAVEAFAREFAGSVEARPEP